MGNPLFVELLHKRYVEFKGLELIAIEMNYTYNHIRHMHGRALENLVKKYKESTQKHINIWYNGNMKIWIKVLSINFFFRFGRSPYSGAVLLNEMFINDGD